MKLGKRLTQIESMITSDYDHIWDCCCDHGFLGMSLLNQQLSAKVHFVDIVPELMLELDNKLSSYFDNNVSDGDRSAWQTHCIDIKNLPLESYSGKQLIIIAGVGGTQTSEFISELCEKYPQLEIDFLLCPVRKLYELRQQLITLKLELKSEILVEENKQFYELILVSKPLATNRNAQAKTVSTTGDQLWHCHNLIELKQAQSYLNNNLKHYQKMHQGVNSPEIGSILKAYQNIDIQLIE
ncbi:MAG: tRNA (adenine(22)-N(1))-methyltransferase TrmK [Oleispira sp.]|nr:tRNA (adenine(22)-N(1))-methyltransferase TrmK [Oleispira sp.]MBL4881390.1 tRNA (adenine(22)-N(1))-methyltransferase TrmK [Oleispira sp.]